MRCFSPVRVAVYSLLLAIAPGVSTGEQQGEAPQAVPTSNMQLTGAASPPDVILPPGTDLQAFTLASLPSLPAGAAVKVLIIPAAAANGHSQSSDYSFNRDVGRYLAGDGFHMAPVYLPHGGDSTTVTINNFIVYAIDNSVEDVTYELWRKEINSTAGAEKIGEVTFVGTSSEVQALVDASILNPIVTSDYAYYIGWRWPGLDREYSIQGFAISYTES